MQVPKVIPTKVLTQYEMEAQIRDEIAKGIYSYTGKSTIKK